MSAGLFNRTAIWLTWRQLFARRRLYIALAVLVVPSVITLLVRFNSGEGDLDPAGALSTVYKELVFGVLLPLIALVFGTTAFGGEVDDGTLIYLMVKPVARWRLALSKYIVALFSAVTIILPSILLAWVAMRNDVPFRVPLAYMAGALVGCMVYCAFFVTLGISSRRALAIGLLYIVAFENVLSRTVVGVKSLSIREFALAVCKNALGGAAEFTDFTVSMNTVYIMGTLFFVAALGLSVYRLQRYEVAERL
jgi:ABC-2 type transport system permease protein